MPRSIESVIRLRSNSLGPKRLEKPTTMISTDMKMLSKDSRNTPRRRSGDEPRTFTNATPVSTTAAITTSTKPSPASSQKAIR